MYVYRNIEARSSSHRCHGKGIINNLICLYSSLRYPAYKAHVLYYIIICGLYGSTIFFRPYLTMTLFSK